MLKDPTKHEELTSVLPPTIRFDPTNYNRKGNVNTQDVFIVKNELGQDEYYNLDEIRFRYKNIVEEYVKGLYSP